MQLLFVKYQHNCYIKEFYFQLCVILDFFETCVLSYHQHHSNYFLFYNWTLPLRRPCMSKNCLHVLRFALSTQGVLFQYPILMTSSSAWAYPHPMTSSFAWAYSLVMRGNPLPWCHPIERVSPFPWRQPTEGLFPFHDVRPSEVSVLLQGLDTWYHALLF